ncbi:MAG: hypothetical protein PHN31_03840 [Candidatus Gracilibacteria bacterium]|nr:hypothetical protein [Candidatus Gracilibacteria bacterium]
MVLTSENSEKLLKLASMSANGMDFLDLDELTGGYKTIVAQLIMESGKGVGDIIFGVQNEGVLKVLHNGHKVYVSVITPTDGVGRNWLY